jgi:hypothetical protein
MNRLAIFDCDGTLVDSQHSEPVRQCPALSQPCRGHGGRLTCAPMAECFRASGPKF